MQRYIFTAFSLVALTAAGCSDSTAPTAPSSVTTHQSALIGVPGDQPTIQAAIDAADPGEVIQVAAGSYNENLTLKSDIIIVGAGAGDTVIFGAITGTDLTSVTLSAFAVDGSLSTEFQGITVTNSTVAMERLAVRGWNTGIAIEGGTGSSVDATDVTNTESAGVLISGGTNVTVTNTTVRFNTLDGIRVSGGSTGVVLANNLAFANGHGSADGAGVWTSDGGAVTISNTISTSNNRGITCAPACSNDYNLVWGNTLNYDADATAGTNNIQLDPRFTSPGENDFTLRFDSPAIDAGTAANAPNTDANGSTRPLGNGYDLGPYEFIADDPTITIAISEVMSNPLDEGNGEFVELFNYGTSAVDVAGFRITDGDAWDTVAAFGGGSTSIPAGGYAVIIDPDSDGAYVDAGALLLTVATTANIGSGLSTSDPVKLYLPDSVTPVDSFSFPFNPGNGISVEKDEINDGDNPGNWVSSPCGSTPGASNCASLPPNVSTSVLIAINEVMSNPLDESTGEFIELYNFGTDPVELAGLTIDDGDSSDTLAAYQGSETLLQPGQFAVIVDPDYPGTTYTIPGGTLLLTVASTATIGNGLANSDPVSLIDGLGQVIDTYTHNFNAGNGVSVEKVAPNIGDIASNFSASSCASGSSPGAVNCVTADGVSPIGEQTLTLSEVMANPLDEDTGEFIEIYNYGADPIDLAGYRIDDGDNEEKLEGYQGGSTVIAAGGYAVIVDSEYAGEYNIPGGVTLLTTPNTTIGSGLSTNDPIRLRAPTGATPIDTYFFPFNPGNGISAEKIDLVVGDVPQNWVASPCNASPGAANCADGGLGGGEAPVSTVAIVISEVMANPLDEDTGEYIELFNAGPVGIDLAGWRVSDGDSIDTIEAFATGSTILPAGGFAVILDAEYANDYVVGQGAIRLKTGDTTLGNGLTTTDPITLYEPDGVTVVDTFSFAYNPGNGRSAEKVTLTAGDTADNWLTSTCRTTQGDANNYASPGRANCVDPYGFSDGTTPLGQPCPFGAADCISGLCAIELQTGNSFCTEACTTGPDSCPSGLTCTAISDANYPDVCIPVGGGAVPNVVINEVLYDAVGGDTEVWLELYGPANTVVDGLTLVGINGADGKAYTSIPLSGQLDANGYFLIAHPDSGVAGGANIVTTKVDFQNGPDSIQLRFGDEVIDALAYGDFSGAVFAGEGTAAVDTAAGESLARNADGVDTDDNGADFTATVSPTPGAAN